MSGSDLSKDALVAGFPGTSEKDWKRTSKAKDGSAVVRTFKNAKTGAEATVREDAGTFTVTGQEITAQAVTATGQAILKVSGVTGYPDSDSIYESEIVPPTAVANKIKTALKEVKVEAPGALVSEDGFESEDGFQYSGRPTANPAPTTDIVAGSYVTAPAGTDVYPASRWSSQNISSIDGEATKSSRGVTVEVKSVFTVRAQDYYHFITDAERAQFTVSRSRGPFVEKYLDCENPALGAAIEARLGTLTMVMWGEKAALITDVTPASAPKKKEPATNQPANKKALMKPKTKWRVSADCEISAWVHNPEYDKNVNANPYRQIDNRRRTQEEHQKLNEWNARVPERVRRPVVRLKAGAVLEVVGKLVTDTFAQYGNDDRKSMTNGHGVLFRLKAAAAEFLGAQKGFFGGGLSRWDYGVPTITGDIAEITLPFKDIQAHVEPEGEVKEQYIYLLRDRATGLFYKTTNYNYFKYWSNPVWTEWNEGKTAATEHLNPYRLKTLQVGTSAWDAAYRAYDKAKDDYEKVNPPPMRSEYRIVQGADPYEMVAKPTQAKQYQDIGRMKSSILTFTGYYSGMDDQQGDMDEWRSSGDDEDARPYPFLDTFEAVKLEKFSKREVEVIDLQNWYQSTWRLRGLTRQFGSSVRTIYKNLEKADRLSELAYVVTFRPPVDEYVRTITAAQTTEINDLIKETFVDKVVQAKDALGISIAVDSLASAIALKLSYTGDGMVHVVDFNAMQEVVG